MDLATIIGLIIAFIAVIGILGTAIWLIAIHNLRSKEERIARIESRSRERIALIGKGMDPNLVDSLPEKSPSNRPLMIGLIIVFACIGRIIAYFAVFGNNHDDKTIIYVLPAFFAGFAVLIYHFYRRKVASK